VNGATQARDTVLEVSRDFDNATATARGASINFMPAVNADTQGNVITVSRWGDANQGTLTLNAYNRANQLNINQNGFVGVGAVPQSKLHVYDNKPVLLVEQNPLQPGGAGLQLTAAGDNSASNAAYVQFHGAGSIWGQTGSQILYMGTASRSASWARLSAIGLGIGTTATSKLHLFDSNPVVKVEHNSLVPGGAGIQLTAAGASSSGNAAYVQFHSGGTIWGQTAGDRLHFGPNSRSLVWMTVSPAGVYSPNGFTQSSSSVLKRDIREITFGSLSQRPPAATVSNPTSVTNTSAQSTAVNPSRFSIPRAIIYKWKKPVMSKAPDADFIGFMGDDLPIEARALREDGTRDPETFYTGAVIGLLCGKVREQDAALKSQDALIKDLLARVSLLEKKK
jgi:hypothetical protein